MPSRPIPPPRGQVTVSRASDEASSVRVELGYRRGAIVLHIRPASGGGPDDLLLDLKWADRPGDPVSVSPEWGFGKEYLTHAKLDLRTGEIYPGWQSE